MKTSKPISTISYNTKDFLIDTLERLKYLRLISYYEFIEHLPDVDDKKKHIHLYIEPNKCLDTEFFSKYFEEIDPKNDKPLRCIQFRSSKFGDWYWYSLHDKDYLKAKMLKRNCYYSDNDIFTCDYDTHIYKVSENPLVNYASMSDVALRQFIYDCVACGKSLQELLNSCIVPLGKIQSVTHFYNALAPYYSPKSRTFKSNEFEQRKEELKAKCVNNFDETVELINENKFAFVDDDPIF